MLTQAQAEALVLARLTARHPSLVLSIVASSNSERSFGWVFEIAVSGDSSIASSAVTVPHCVIVNKHSHQVVASSMNLKMEHLVRLYEKLLAKNQVRSQQWCGTMPLPFPWTLWRKRTVAERAKEGGFYEIDGKEGET